MKLGNHGWHCECVVCKTGKGVGIFRACTSCAHPSHKKASPKAKKRSKK